MKTIITTILLGVFISTSYIYANDPDKKTFSFEEKTEWGCIKESTYFDESGNQPEKKEIIHTDKTDKVLTKETYQWDARDGWVGLQQDQFEHNLDGKITKAKRARWDSKQKSWSANIKIYTYSYDSDGELVAIK